MAQYINKSALVAEIEDWRDKIKKGIFSIPLHGSERAYATFEYEILGKVRDFIDTFEVKEVDISSEVSNWWNNHYTGVKKDYTFEDYNGHYMDNSTIISLAQHFFELGLNSQTKDMQEAIRTEYEKGRADVIQATKQWLANSWPKYCDNPNIIDAFKENVIED